MEAVMDRQVIDDITAHYRALAAVIPLHPIRSEASHDKAVAVLNQLLHAGASGEASPLADLGAALGMFIADFEDVHCSTPAATPPRRCGS